MPLSGCEVNSFEPIVGGTEIPFLTPIFHQNPEIAFYEQHGGEATQENWPGVPQLTRSTWSMQIGGLTSNPLTLNFQDLPRSVEPGDSHVEHVALYCR